MGSSALGANNLSITWRHVLALWWAYMWRWMSAALILSVSFLAVAGRMNTFVSREGATGAVAWAIFVAAWNAAYIMLSVYVFMIALKRKYRKNAFCFRIIRWKALAGEESEGHFENTVPLDMRKSLAIWWAWAWRQCGIIWLLGLVLVVIFELLLKPIVGQGGVLAESMLISFLAVGIMAFLLISVIMLKIALTRQYRRCGFQVEIGAI